MGLKIFPDSSSNDEYINNPSEVLGNHADHRFTEGGRELPLFPHYFPLFPFSPSRLSQIF
jgi:hypothetical protein